MPLPQEVVKLFNNPAARKTLSTIDSRNTVHAAPLGSLGSASDGSILSFAENTAEETPKRLRHMKRNRRLAVAVVQFVDLEKRMIEGYSVRCRVGDRFTSGPLYDQHAEITQKLLGTKPKAAWTLLPVSYKIHTIGPQRGKVVKL